MAHPKRRHSHARSRIRRSHDGLTDVKVGTCPVCGSPKAAHQVCGYCGHYRGVQVIKMEAEDEEKAE